MIEESNDDGGKALRVLGYFLAAAIACSGAAGAADRVIIGDVSRTVE
ncbi:MAG TPA: hypothetical protein VEI95_13615 [Acidobacteriota bacterium]|nr:hypothetical protein [Acidobacteriota bacterium]